MLRHATRTNAWTARRLDISRHVVKNHWSMVIAKLGIDAAPPRRRLPQRLRALMRALELGIVALDEVDVADDERRWPAGWHLGWHPDYQEVFK